MIGSMILAFIISVVAIVLTLRVTKTEDKEYNSQKSAGNLFKMYLLLFPVVIVSLIVYWIFF
ncbi:hypothetical protein [Alkalihalobacterium alkalinitrilicum]|uniref:hypothetical protein n=1 Tax=Alkalihalobacterium alkalinitrilicum TaxID=427920 RepID=UPI000994B041|nr:hypothetical protein [Alkalihalobacterium alkalinitrilicum]